MVEDIDAKEKVLSKANVKDGRLNNIQKSSMEEFEKFTKENKIPSNKLFIKEKLIEDLKGIFGKDIEIMVGY